MKAPTATHAIRLMEYEDEIGLHKVESRWNKNIDRLDFIQVSGLAALGLASLAFGGKNYKVFYHFRL